MLVRDYALSERDSEYLLISESLADLLTADEGPELVQRPSLLVWRGALDRVALADAMLTSTWPLDLLKALPPGPDWPWELSSGDMQGERRRAEIEKCVRQAAGVKGSPETNMVATLALRSYKERDSLVGGLDWWLSRARPSSPSGGFGEIFVAELIDLLERARSAQSELYVEQISVILAKDPGAPLASLTPTLHSDSYYGRRESAIVSLLESGWDSHGGAMFMPTCTMEALWSLRPLGVEKILQELPDRPLLMTNSGDVAIYDGMIGPDDVARPSNGIPHISSDRAGESARIAILMLHRRHSSETPQS